MKRKLFKSLSMLLCLVLLVGLLPAVAVAADNEWVLSSITHDDFTVKTGQGLTAANDRAVTLLVPYSYGATVNLSSGLSYPKYSTITSVALSGFTDATDNPIGSPFTVSLAAAAGSTTTVKMEITYAKGTTNDTTKYAITFERASAVPGTFTGTVSKTATVVPTASTTDITFALNDFKSKYTAKDSGAFTGISIEALDASYGTFSVGGTAYTPGDFIAEANIAGLTFDATAATPTGGVNFMVRAYGTSPTAKVGGVTLNIAVTAITKPTSLTAITKSVTNLGTSATYTFTAADFTGHCNLNNGHLASVEITPLGTGTGAGAWSYNSTPFTGATTITDVTKLKFTGTTSGTVNFSWKISNEAGISATSGTGTFTVTAISVPTALLAITKSVADSGTNATYTFTATDFTSRCTMNNGHLASVEITPLGTGTGAGAWSYNSTPFTGATTITDVTKLKFTGTASGTVNFSWKISNEAGISATSGTGTITVTALAVPTTSGTVAKSIYKGVTYVFTVADFSAKYNLNGGTLQSIAITPATTSSGTWYLGNSPFTTATTVSESLLSGGQLKFVAGSAAGSASFTWTVSNEAGASVARTGNLITVQNAASNISYSATAGTAKVFAATDFNTACTAATGTGMSTTGSVTFTAPSSAYGTLRYNYTSTASPGTAIAAGGTYTCAYNDLGKMAFVPASTVVTSASISYTGTSTTGSTYPGTVLISFGGSGVTYTTAMNTAKTFDYATFYTAYPNLSTVIFSAPSSGALYLNYTTSGTTTSAVNTPISLASLGTVTFVPTTNYTGTVTIYFTGYLSTGTTMSGTVTITVGTASGGVTYTTAMNTPKTFDYATFYTAYPNLSTVIFSAPSSGALYLNYTTSGTTTSAVNTPISLASLGTVTFVPTTNYTGTVTIYFTGYLTTGTTVTGTVTITVGTGSGVTYTTAMNTAKTFDYATFYTAYPNLSTVIFSAPSSGALYLNYTTSGTTTSAVNTPVSLASLGTVTFVPTTNYTGTVTIYFTGYLTTGTTVTGTVTITVGTGSGVTYTTAMNTPKTFDYATFYTAYPNLSTVIFSAPSSGALYLNYTTSGTTTSAVNTPVSLASLGTVTYVPTTNYTGTVTIYFTGYLTTGTTVTGTVTITVGTGSGVTYTTAMNTPKTFDYATFYTAYPNLSTVIFSAPSSGALYLNYTTSGGTTSAVNTPVSLASLGTVTYVPTTNYTGTVTIYFTGYLTTGTTVTGTVTITVGTSGITYTTAKNTPKTFDYATFYTAYPNLSTITFTSISSGTLKTGYSSATSSGTNALNTSIPAASLGNVTFIPASNYTGTVTINFTGYTTTGTTVTGTVTITVGTTGITYSTTMNTPKKFVYTDFTTAYPTLTSVIFTSVSSGTLYNGYTSASSPGTNALNTTIPATSLSSITYVPASSYKGTVTISFTGYTSTGATVAGIVTITVSGAVSDISLTTNEDISVTFNAASFNTVCTTATGETLSFVKFTLPSSAQGSLIYYTGSGTKSSVTATTAYNYSSSPSISYVNFVPATNYKGTVTINYTGTTTNGTTYSGKVVITVKDVAGSSFFTDVNANYEWAADAVDALYQLGIVNGTGSNLYGPNINISRGDFILMLHRALNFSGKPDSMFPDVPSGSYYYDAIAAAKAMGIAQGNNGNFNPKGALTRQDAMVLIYRALKATNHYLLDGTSSDIAGYSDKSKIAPYALTAVQTLVKANIITGSGGQLNPLGNLSRAEMAVIIYRVYLMI